MAVIKCNWNAYLWKQAGSLCLSHCLLLFWPGWVYTPGCMLWCRAASAIPWPPSSVHLPLTSSYQRQRRCWEEGDPSVAAKPQIVPERQCRRKIVHLGFQGMQEVQLGEDSSDWAPGAQCFHPGFCAQGPDFHPVNKIHSLLPPPRLNSAMILWAFLSFAKKIVHFSLELHMWWGLVWERLFFWI